jgi:hypothetical protein
MCGSVGWNPPEGLISRSKRLISAQMHTRGCYQGQPRLAKRFGKRQEGSVIVFETGEVQDRLTLDLAQVFNSWHFIDS